MAKLKATSLRNTLVFLMIAIIALAAVGFYFGLQIVKGFGVEVSRTVADADASGDSVGSLQELKEQLAERQALIIKANNIFATPANYQTQALSDVQRYANRYGLKIADYSFGGQQNSGPQASNGRPMTITFENPASYTGLIRFLDAIEGNLPKIRVVAIDLSRPDNASSNNININKLTIEIFTR